MTAGRRHRGRVMIEFTSCDSWASSRCRPSRPATAPAGFQGQGDRKRRNDPAEHYQRLFVPPRFQRPFDRLFDGSLRTETLKYNGVGEACCAEGPGQYAASQKKDGWKQRLSNRRRRCHGFIADTLFRQLPTTIRRPVLAHHLIHIVNDTERCQYLTAAGDLHLNAFRAEDALQCYTKVLDDLSTRHGEDEDRLFARTAIQYSKVSTARHDTAHVLSILKAALQRAEKRNLQGTQAILKMHMAKNEWLRSRYDSAMHWFDQGWALAKELNEPRLMRSAMNFSTFFLYWQGRFKDAIQIYEQSVSDIENYPGRASTCWPTSPSATATPRSAR